MPQSGEYLYYSRIYSYEYRYYLFYSYSRESYSFTALRFTSEYMKNASGKGPNGLPPAVCMLRLALQSGNVSVGSRVPRYGSNFKLAQENYCHKEEWDRSSKGVRTPEPRIKRKKKGGGYHNKFLDWNNGLGVNERNLVGVYVYCPNRN